MKTIAIIQARMGSRRLPGKVLMLLNGKPIVEWVLKRLMQCTEIDNVVLATTASSVDDPLVNWAKDTDISYFRGDESDVLGRYYHTCKYIGMNKEDIVVRITGDCPFIDPEICDYVIRRLKCTGADYVSNTNPPTFPDGLDCEALNFFTLERLYKEAQLKYEREHVTQYILRHPELFTIENITNNVDLSHMRWTLDELGDYNFIYSVAQGLKTIDFTMQDVLNHLQLHPEATHTNMHIERNEGLSKSILEENNQ